MNQLSFMEKLLDGVEVEWKALGTVCKVFNGYAFQSGLFNTVGDGLPLIRIRDVNTGFSDTYYSGVYDDRYLVCDGDILIGMDGDFRAVRWKHGCALLNQRVCRLQDFTAEMLSGFMYYIVQDELNRIQNRTQGSTVKHLSSRELECAKIPIPPLHIQTEIVRILDTFTALTTELTARKKQYNYYRDQLLSFENSDVEWKTLGEIGEFIRGKRFTKADYVDEGIPVIHYGEIYTRYGVFTEQAYSQVREDMAASLRYAEPGDVVITDVGETVEDVGKAVAWLGYGKVAIHDHCYALRHTMNPKFISYCMQTTSFIAEKAKYVARTKVNTLLINGFAKIAIPVPPIEVQNRIVSILDKFNVLTNSISEGLPREIELRQKQYEYYRDLLLSFPKPADAALSA